jgi:hypothetical protein
VRCPRMGPYTLFSGSFGHQSPGTMTGAGSVPLDWDRRRRATPASAILLAHDLFGKPYPLFRIMRQTASQETWPEAEPWGRRLPLVRAAVERRKASGLRSARAVPDGTEVVHCAFRRSASLFLYRHCEERSDEAIHMWTAPGLQGWRAVLDGSLASICPACLMQSHMTAGQDGFRDGVPHSTATSLRHWIARSVSGLGSIDPPPARFPASTGYGET